MSSVGIGGRVRSSKWVKGASRLRVGSWNIGTLTGKYIELVKILKKRKINIACVQETKWVGTKARDVDGFKLWYSGGSRKRIGVGILVDRELREQVVEVRRVNDRMMMIKLVIGGLTLSIISAYAPQAGLGEEVKKRFWEDLDEALLQGVYDAAHRGFGFGDRNEGGVCLLDFAVTFEWVIANSSFSKREEHLVTFHSSVARTQIDYLLLRKADRVLFKDCKVIPSENLTTQHKLLVMDLKIKRKRHKKALCVRPEDQIGWLDHYKR
nr:craniofacial development protein 2-like [Nicotiana tomentosiformis]